MICNHCKKSISDGTRFCPNCGNEVWNAGNTSLPEWGMIKAAKKSSFAQKKAYENKTQTKVNVWDTEKQAQANQSAQTPPQTPAFATTKKTSTWLEHKQALYIRRKFIITALFIIAVMIISNIPDKTDQTTDYSQYTDGTDSPFVSDQSYDYDSGYDDTYSYDEAPVIEAKPVSEITEAGEHFEMGQWRGEPIVWRVLEVRDGQALVITKDILCMRQYDGLEEYGERLADNDDYSYWEANASWQNSDIRIWLNEDLLTNAFSASEMASIKQSQISTPVYIFPEDWGDDFENLPPQIGETATADYLFLLSADETTKYFADQEDRTAHIKMTQEDVDYISQVYEADMGFEQESIDLFESTNEKYINDMKTEYWWLRFDTAADNSHLSWYVDDRGRFYNIDHLFAPYGVRPAMWIDLTLNT